MSFTGQDVPFMWGIQEAMFLVNSRSMNLPSSLIEVWGVWVSYFGLRLVGRLGVEYLFLQSMSY